MQPWLAPNSDPSDSLLSAGIKSVHYLSQEKEKSVYYHARGLHHHAQFSEDLVEPYTIPNQPQQKG